MSAVTYDTRQAPLDEPLTCIVGTQLLNYDDPSRKPCEAATWDSSVNAWTVVVTDWYDFQREQAHGKVVSVEHNVERDRSTVNEWGYGTSIKIERYPCPIITIQDNPQPSKR